MSELPLPAKFYSVVLIALSSVLALALLASEGSVSGRTILGSLAAAGCIATAWFRPFPLSFKRKLFLDTSALVLTILLFEPGMAMLITGVGTMAAYIGRRNDWAEGLFNSAQMMAQAAVGSLVLALGGYDQTLGDLDQPLGLFLVVVAGMLMFVVNNAAVALMVSLQSGMAVRTVGRRVFSGLDRVELIGYLAQLGLGVAGAVVILAAPWMIPLLIFPAAAVYLMIDRSVTSKLKVELSLKERDLDLAEAQRIAKLGSWRWDLVSGIQVWSNETYQILSLDRDERPPSYELFLSTVHPEDRGSFDAAVHETLYAQAPFNLEHRICRPDGRERIVHQRGEVIFDAEGNKSTIVGTIQDITERKKLEKQIEHFAERDRIEAERAEGRRKLAASRELERLRLARELHDGPVQNLLAISYNLAANHRNEAQLKSNGETTSSREHIRGDILAVVADLRSLIGELRPPGLSEFGLATALEGYIAELTRHQGDKAPSIVVDLDGASEELPEQVALSAFRIVQEGLRNAILHASADEVRISMARTAGKLRLQICDDGQGFRMPKHINELAEHGHFGLIGLVERVDQLSGEVAIDSEAGKGTTINVIMPVSGEEERDG
ncbi:MAG: PAS domain-containing protein [Thermomicrobiales bacterium]